MQTYHYRKVATVLTVYGIETLPKFNKRQQVSICRLQQYLPFTVLKLLHCCGVTIVNYDSVVATVLTVYGIETEPYMNPASRAASVATVLTVYGIETIRII